MKRALAVGAAVLCLPGAASAGVELRGVDTGAYPRVRLTVVTSPASSEAPRVREAGAPAAGVAAVNLAGSKSVVLAVDRSRSMAGRPLADSIAAAQLYLGRKGRLDRVAIVAFGSTAAELVPFSASAGDASAALGALTVDPEEGTALNDALLASVRLLAGEGGGAKVVLLLTDGRDTSSSSSLPQAIEAARREGVLVHAIGLRGSTFSPAGPRRIAAATGGRYTLAASPAALPAVYARLAAELRRTWRVEYVTAAAPGRRVPVSVTVPRRGTARGSIALPGANAAAAATPWYARGLLGDVVLAAVVAVLALLAAKLAASYRRTQRLRRRLLGADVPGGTAPRSSLRERLTGAASGLFGATERAFGERRQWSALERTIERAGLPLRAVELAYACLGTAFLVGFVAGALGFPGPVVLLAFGLGATLPLLVVRVKANRRTAAFDAQLPDLLLTLASALKSGQSFRAGLQAAAEEGREPASSELRLALAESRLGRPLDDALAEMAERLGSENFRYVVNAVAIQREVGGSLAGLFDMVSDTVRARQQFGRKVKALTAMGRMSAYVMIGLPFGLALALTAMNAEYMAPLWTTGAGQAMVTAALVMIAFGWIVIRRIVSFGG